MAKLLGQLLLEAGAISGDDLALALDAQARGQPERVGELLVQLGKLDPAALVRALAQQSGLEPVELEPILPEVAGLLPLDFQVQHRLVPFHLETAVKGPILHVAVADPAALGPLEELALQQGQQLKVWLGAPDQIEAAQASWQGRTVVGGLRVPPRPSPGLPTAPAPPAAGPGERKPPPVPPALKVAIPPAPARPLPRKPVERPPERPRPAPSPDPLSMSEEELGFDQPTLIRQKSFASPGQLPAPAAEAALLGVPLPEWLTDGADAPAPGRASDRALQLKLEALFVHGGSAAAGHALATVVALLVRRGVLREQDLLDALGRK